MHFDIFGQFLDDFRTLSAASKTPRIFQLSSTRGLLAIVRPLFFWQRGVWGAAAPQPTSVYVRTFKKGAEKSTNREMYFEFAFDRSWGRVGV